MMLQLGLGMSSMQWQCVCLGLLQWQCGQSCSGSKGRGQQVLGWLRGFQQGELGLSPEAVCMGITFFCSTETCKMNFREQKVQTVMYNAAVQHMCVGCC